MTNTSIEDVADLARHAALLEKANRQEQTLLIPIIAYIIILMVCGLIGNLLVLYVYTFRFRRSSSRTFILSLAILDTLTCLFGMPYHIVDMMYSYMFYDVTACKTLSYIMTLSLLCSIYVFVLIAIDRYRKVCKPFKKQISHIGTKTATSLAIVLAAICSMPNVFLYGHSTIIIPGTQVHGVECFIADMYNDTIWPMMYNGFLVFIFISCTVILSVLYVLVGIKVWRQGSFGSNDENRGKNGQWKLCGGSSPHTTEEVLSEYDNPKVRVKAISYHKTSDVDGNQLSNGNEDNKQGEQLEVEYSEDEDTVFRSKMTQTSFKNNSFISHKNSHHYKALGNKRTAFHEVRLHNMSTSDDESENPRRISNTGSRRMSLYQRSINLSRKQKRSLKITCMLFLITVVFVISFLPHLVLMIMDAVDENFWWDVSDAENLLYHFFLRTYFINNMANPIIYGCLDVRFRLEVCALIKKIFQCKCAAIFGK